MPENYGNWDHKETPEDVKYRTECAAWCMDKLGLLALIILALVLAGCASSQQQHAEKCQSYGLTPGTGAYSQCMDQLVFNDQMAYEQQQQALQQNTQHIQNQLMNISHPYGY